MRITFLVVLFLTGCATSLPPNQTRIMFYSNPAGAMISTPGHNWGVAPQQLIWTLNAATFLSEPITATWVSGASTTTKMNLIAGQDGSFTLQRPQGVAGVDGDIQWAIHLEQKQQANDEAWAAAFKNAVPTPRKTTNCTSNVIGTQVYTNCY
jgi:hypothetical protein